MRSHAMKPDGEFRRRSDPETRAVAVSPWRGGVSHDLRLPVEFGAAQKSFSKNGLLEFQLVRIIGVLVVTSAALGEVWARRLNAPVGGLQQFLSNGPRISRLFFRDRSIHFFAGQHQRHEDSLTSGIAGKSVAAVDHFVDGQVHVAGFWLPAAGFWLPASGIWYFFCFPLRSSRPLR